MPLHLSPFFEIGILISGKAKTFILWSWLLKMDYITLFNVTRQATEQSLNPQLIVWIRVVCTLPAIQ